MHRSVRPFLATLCVLGTAHAMTAPASQAAYTAPVPFAGAGEMTRSLVAGAATDGSAAIAYAQAGQIRVAVKAPGELFGPAVTIGPGRAPQLAMGANGRAIVSWISPTDEARVALRAPGAAAFTEVAPIAAGDTYGVAVAVAENGRAFAAAQLVNGALMSSYDPGSTDAIPAVELLPTGAPTSVAIASQGNGDIAWLLVNSRSATSSHATARRWSSSLGQGPQLELTADANFSPGAPATITYGAAVGVPGAQPSFLWSRLVSAPGLGTGQASSSVARVDGPLTAPTSMNLTTGINTTGGITPARSVPSVAAAPDGGALVGWVDTLGDFGANPTINVTSRLATGQWSSPLAITGLTSPFSAPVISNFVLAPGQAGGAQALYPVVPDRIITASISAARTMQNPEPTLLRTAPAGFQVGEVAASGAGNGDTALAWAERSTTTGDGVVQVALGDVTPPTLTVAPAPTGQTTQYSFMSADAATAFRRESRSLTLTATATDRWTPSTITWDFGDGTTATGASVTHQFDPGLAEAKITVTARDLAGNASTEQITRAFPTVLVAEPPKGFPPPPTEITLSGFKLSRTSFAVVKPGKPATRKAKKGATVTFTLSAAGKVEFGVTAKARGYRSGQACVVKKPKGTAKPKRCSFDRQLGLAGIANGVAGPNSFSLTGKVAGKFLKPGTYTLTAGIFPKVQSHATTAATAKFTIVK